MNFSSIEEVVNLNVRNNVNILSLMLLCHSSLSPSKYGQPRLKPAMPGTFDTLHRCLPNKHKLPQDLDCVELDLGTDTKENI
jgi:hypothetical protein